MDAFSRLLFSNLCSCIDKVIYTDVDVVFRDDITKLFNEALQDNIVGAVEGISYYNGKDNLRFNIDKHHHYFQSSLLLIDCKKWRKANITLRWYEIMHNFSKLRH